MAIKLVLNMVLSLLVLVALRPEVNALAEEARRFATGLPAAFVESNIVFPPVVSTAALLIAISLAVFKPWGLIRGRRSARRTEKVSG